MKTPGRKFLYIFLSIVLCLIVFLLRSFFYDNLVDPIARIFWLIARLLLSIDQVILWIILIILVLFVGLLIFPNEQQNKIRSSYVNSNQIEDRITYWKMKFLSADRNAYARDSLQQKLEELAASIEELLGRNQKCEISLPKLKTKTLQIFGDMLTNFFKRISTNGNKFLDRELERSLNHSLDSMESLMEIQYDQKSNSPKNR